MSCRFRWIRVLAANDRIAPFRQIRTRMSIEIAPGMISTAMAGQSVPAAAATAATRTGPATAPT